MWCPLVASLCCDYLLAPTAGFWLTAQSKCGPIKSCSMHVKYLKSKTLLVQVCPHTASRSEGLLCSDCSAEDGCSRTWRRSWQSLIGPSYCLNAFSVSLLPFLLGFERRWAESLVWFLRSSPASPSEEKKTTGRLEKAWAQQRLWLHCQPLVWITVWHDWLGFTYVALKARHTWAISFERLSRYPAEQTCAHLFMTAWCCRGDAAVQTCKEAFAATRVFSSRKKGAVNDACSCNMAQTITVYCCGSSEPRHFLCNQRHGRIHRSNKWIALLSAPDLHLLPFFLSPGCFLLYELKANT